MDLNDTDKKVIDQIIEVNSNSARIHEYQAVEISEFNHLDLGFYKRKTVEAGESGFEWLVDLESPTIDRENKTRTAIRLLAQEDRKTICALYHFKPSFFMRMLATIFRMGPLKIVEFETLFSDNTFVVTTTSQEKLSLGPPPGIKTQQVSKQPFETHFNLHHSNVDKHLAENPNRSVVQLLSFDDLIQAQKSQDQIKLEYMQAQHFLGINQLPKSMRNDPDTLKAALAYAKTKSPITKNKQKILLTDFEKQLASHGFKFDETEVVSIDGLDKSAFVVTTENDKAEQDRLELQELFHGKYYPVITDLFIQGNDLAEAIENLGLLSRYPFESEMEFRMQEGANKCDPESLITQSQLIDINAAIEPFILEHGQFEDDVIEEIRFELEEVKRIIGAAPKLSSFNKLIDNGKIKSQIDLQRILLSWILKNKKAAAMEISKVDFNAASRVTTPNRYTPKIQAKCVIFLVPVQNMSEVPAYIHWEGSDQIGSAATCQLLKQWQEKYHAQLVAVDANSMEFHLPKPIGNIKEAFEMAVIHNALTPSMLGVSCNSIWYYALTLLRTKNWCLWSTP